ncbi:hypothetical protein C8R45DRAFT_1107963 [Mycena sanguinolenta]|nr:hypothetical protein C8R45DRAFT_1107963 [Mycena sanguinolenta]
MAAAPLLPLGLERENFQICALSQPVFIPKLMLVAQHIKEWQFSGLSLFYIGQPCWESIYQASLSFPTTTYPLLSVTSRRRSSATLCAIYWHSLLTKYPAPELKIILRLCTGVENLWILNADETSMSLVESFALKRLSAVFEFMPPPTAQMFARLAHLHLGVHLDENMDSVQALVMTLPPLTHLSFSFDVFENAGFVFLMIHRILELSPPIPVLIIFDDSVMSWAHKVPADIGMQEFSMG